MEEVLLKRKVAAAEGMDLQYQTNILGPFFMNKLARSGPLHLSCT